MQVVSDMDDRLRCSVGLRMALGLYEYLSCRW